MAGRAGKAIDYTNVGKLSMEIINKDEIDSWLFEHAVNRGHVCEAIQGFIFGSDPGNAPKKANVAFIDRKTGERVDVIWM